MKREVLSKSTILLMIIVLILSSFYAGTSIENRVQNVTNEKTEIIAVVNLDEGIDKADKDGNRIYYSNELLKYNQTEYEMVSLESARNGVLEGRYAAYIIIPADFSEKIESVNYEPAKAQITYAINPYLDYEVREIVIRKLETLYCDINYDISYLYVSAILKEFHDVQDASDVILKNDQADIEELQSVDSEQLIALFTYPELEYVETEIEELDLSLIFKDNQQVGVDMEEGLQSDLLMGKDAYQEVQGQSIYIFDATNMVLVVIDEYQPGYDAEGELIYKEGLETISENFARYNTEQSDNGDRIKQMARQESNRIGAVAANRKIVLLQTAVDNYLQQTIYGGEYKTTLKRDFLAYQSDVNEYYKQLGVSENDLYDYTSLDNYLDEMLSKRQITINLFDLTGGSVSQNEIATLTADQQFSWEFVKIVDQTSSVSMNDIVEIVDNQIIDKLSDQQEERYQLVQEKRDELAEQITLYDQLIIEYDPYDYVDEERMDTSMELLGENIYLIEEKQSKHDEEYLELIEEVYEVTENNQEAFGTNLEESQEVTRENVETIIEVLKANKEDTSQQNKELLESFTRKLAYTRLGSLGNIEAYDFVVSPTTFEENHIDRLILDIGSGYRQYILVAMAIFMVLTILCFHLSMMLKRKERMEQEEKNNFS